MIDPLDTVARLAHFLRQYGYGRCLEAGHGTRRTMSGPNGRTRKQRLKLSTWARREGIPIRTAQRRFHEGSLPVPTMVTETGRLMVLVDDDRAPPMTPEELTREVQALKRQQNRIERKLDAVLTALGAA